VSRLIKILQVLCVLVTWIRNWVEARRAAAVRADPGSAWVQRRGGTDVRGVARPGTDDAGRNGD